MNISSTQCFDGDEAGHESGHASVEYYDELIQARRTGSPTKGVASARELVCEVPVRRPLALVLCGLLCVIAVWPGPGSSSVDEPIAGGVLTAKVASTDGGEVKTKKIHLKISPKTGVADSTDELAKV